MKFLSQFLALLLTPLLIILPISAQTPVPSADATAKQDASSLQLRLVDGELTARPAGSRSNQGLTVEVTSASGSLVSEAAVFIGLPDNGVTGAFPDGSHSAVAYTNASGHALFPVIQWGNVPGVAAIRITATKGGVHAGILVEQKLTDISVSRQPNPPASPASPGTPVTIARSGASTPVPEHPSPNPPAATEPTVSITNTGAGGSSHSNKKWLWLALLGVGAGVGAAMAMKGKGSSSPSSNTSGLSIGSPSVSVGH